MDAPSRTWQKRSHSEARLYSGWVSLRKQFFGAKRALRGPLTLLKGGAVILPLLPGRLSFDGNF
jgi:hypothetical protein